MVLETSSMQDSYDTFPDTPDPYDSNPTTNSTESLKSEIERSQAPRPVPIFGPLFGFTSSYRAKLFADRLAQFREATGHDAAGQERQALLFHQSKAIRYLSYGVPVGNLLGLYRAWQTRETYRIPFYGSAKSPDGWFDGERVRIMGRTLLQGNLARNSVHAFRASIYCSYVYLGVGIFMASVAAAISTVGEATDPRLKDYRDAMIKRSRQRSKPKDPTGQGDTSMTDLWTRHRRGIGAKDTGTVDHDASPSAGTDDFFGADAERLSDSNTGIMSDVQMRTQERRQQASPEKSPTENRATTFQMDKVARQPDSFDDNADDASPTAQSNTSGSQSGSAWDRIRKQAQTGSAGTGRRGQRWDALQKEQQQGSTTGDSYTFSSTDQDRELAKSEAQDDFDARVEKERHGGSFDDRKGKRW
ncbi:MAG: hypothetical protein LQ350_005576 [Teloschistes chrysophthalmus]|nr:MAG: hypothetical protein LQ350_005576 [Niorma chrysophthalma]